MKTYQRIASLLGAIDNCKKSDNLEWEYRHAQTIEDIMQGSPSGSGFDNGTFLSEKSTPDKLVFDTSYHHMNECGMYDGWTEHTVTVRPSLAFGYVLSVSGRDRNDIKEYIADTFSQWLDEACDPAGMPAPVVAE